MVIFTIQKSWEETCSILNGRGWFHKGLEKLSATHRSSWQNKFSENSFIEANISVQ